MTAPRATHPGCGEKGGFVPRARYLSGGFAALEAQRLWPRVWQLACREAEIPEAGDWLTYDCLGESTLLVRQGSGALRAFANTCPHRGNRLVEGRGSARRFQCAFHCWTFGLDGALRSVPERDGFPPLDERRHGLREVRAESWGGFVFVHGDPDAQTLRAYLGGLVEELAPYRFEEMTCFLRRRLVLPANWKTCLDAFQEVYHVRGIHPQLLPALRTAESTFAFWGPHSKMVNPYGVAEARGSGGPEDRELLARQVRQRAAQFGFDLDALEETRLVDNHQFHIFPNVSFNTHATGCQLFRFLPHPREVEACVLDVCLLERVHPGSPRPPDAGVVEVDLAGTSFGATLAGFAPPPAARSFGEELVQVYALALDQDFALIPEVQRGLRSSAGRDLVLSAQERRITHWNATLDAWLEGPGLDPAWRTRAA
jgi:phenylpropionate dioxygenase-like ring-hydroxylating dioxygenase large terminal subunit